jgi:hypothetical protein
MSTATVYDLKPGQIRRRMEMPPAQVSPQTSSIFADLADGAAVAQFFCNFAGFKYDDTKFFLLIIGLCGEGERSVSFFDNELAEHARCTDRTIRSWRKAYLEKAEKLSFWPLDIEEGEYNRERKRFEKASYTIPADLLRAVEQAVEEARAMPDYADKRLKALERAASDHYDSIPNAPSKRRTRKPKKSLRSPFLQSLRNADQNLDNGKRALAQMPARMKDALLAGEGENLRELLLKIRGEVDELLSAVSETTDNKEVNDIPEIFSGTPPGKKEEASEAEDEGVQGGTRFRDKEEDTRKQVTEEVHSPEACAIWSEVEECIRAPQIRRVEVQLRADESPPLIQREGSP